MTNDQTSDNRKQAAIRNVVDLSKSACRLEGMLALELFELELALGELAESLGKDGDNPQDIALLRKALKTKGVDMPDETLTLSTIERAMLKRRREQFRIKR